MGVPPPMSLPKAHVFAFDADGCLYSPKYLRLIIEVINRHWDFLETYGTKEHFFDVNVAEIKQKTDDIINEINTIELSEEDVSNPGLAITNPLFRDRVHSIHSKLLELNSKPSIPYIVGSIMYEFIGYMNRLNKELLPSLFLAANSELIAHLCKKMEILDIPGFALLPATNRQSYYTDRAGMEQNGTGSIYQDLHEIKSEMQKQLQNKTCLVSHFCMADIFGNKLKRGESYRNIFNEDLLNDAYNSYFQHADSIYDTRKLSLLYAIAHDVVNHVLAELDITDKHAEVTIDFFDDRLDIHEPLAEILAKYPRLLPDNVTINFFHFDGKLRMNPIASVKGTGVLDLNYWKNVKLMAKMCGHDLHTYSLPIDTISQLDIDEFLAARVTGQELAPSLQINFASLFPPKKEVNACAEFAAANTTIESENRIPQKKIS